MPSFGLVENSYYICSLLLKPGAWSGGHFWTDRQRERYVREGRESKRVSEGESEKNREREGKKERD